MLSLGLAFLAGVLLASLGVWLAQSLDVPNLVGKKNTHSSPVMASRTSTLLQAPQKPVKTLQRRAGGNESKKTEVPDQRRGEGRVQKKTSLPVAGVGNSSSSVTGGEISAKGAAASALMDLKKLPYEESLRISLDERIHQVDYSLVQAAWIEHIPASSLRLASVKKRLAGGSSYLHQSIGILPGRDTSAYINILKNCLAIWVEEAELRKTGNNRWSVFVDGKETHCISLYPGKSVFPPLPLSPKTQDLRRPPPRLRKKGEEARLVLIIDDLGASPTAVKRLLALNFPVSFAFWPHGAHTRAGAEAVYNAHREILVHQPMEPLGYPGVKPGPDALLVTMNAGQIQDIVRRSIAAVPHAVGLNNHMGSRFTQDASGVKVVLEVLKGHGFFMLDSLTHIRSVFADEAGQMGVQSHRRDVFLDDKATRGAILEQLRRAERIALLSGQAIAIGHPLPKTLTTLEEWQRLRNHEVRIVQLRDLDE